LAVSSDDKNRPQQIGHTIAEISEKTSLLVREEIELAKAEISRKASRLGKGTAVAAIAGIFALGGLMMLLHTIAWFFVWLIGSEIVWGFLATTVILFVFAGIAAAIGVRWIKKGAPPTPDMAIDEAKKIRDTVSSS
jgi:uncharacterized membrane protein YqjE